MVVTWWIMGFLRSVQNNKTKEKLCHTGKFSSTDALTTAQELSVLGFNLTESILFVRRTKSGK